MFIPVSNGNRFQSLVRSGIDQVTTGAASLKRARSLIEAMLNGGTDYAVAANQFNMPAGEVQALHSLLVASEQLSGSDSFSKLTTILG